MHASRRRWYELSEFYRLQQELCLDHGPFQRYMTGLCNKVSNSRLPIDFICNPVAFGLNTALDVRTADGTLLWKPQADVFFEKTP